MKRRYDRFISHKFDHNVAQVHLSFRINLLLRRWRKSSSTSTRLPHACRLRQQFQQQFVCFAYCGILFPPGFDLTTELVMLVDPLKSQLVVQVVFLD